VAPATPAPAQPQSASDTTSAAGGASATPAAAPALTTGGPPPTQPLPPSATPAPTAVPTPADEAQPNDPQPPTPGAAVDGPRLPVIAAIMASGAPAALMPRMSAAEQANRPLLMTPSDRTALASRPRPGAGGAATKPSPAAPGGGGKGPAPPGPPGSAGFGAGSTAPGGLSSALWCDVIIVLLALACGELRRYRLRPTLTGPAGFTPLLQRPG
jgi:hypothetical protein